MAGKPPFDRRRFGSAGLDWQCVFGTGQSATTPQTSLSEQVKVLAQPRLLLVFAITALGYGGTFTAFTFIAPILENVSGFASTTISILMLVYGVSVAVGNIWGGKLADKHGPTRALTIIFTA